MKKTLLSVIAGLAVINVASAAPSVADRKALCEKHPDKYVWVAKTEACIPINPCKSSNDGIKESYCSDVFKKIQIGRRDDYKVLVETYLEKVMGVTGSPLGGSNSLLGDDFVSYKTSDNGYIVFRFDDLSDLTASDRVLGAIYGACLAHGGNSSYAKGLSGKEKEVPSPKCSNFKGTCQDIADLASRVVGIPMKVGEEGIDSDNFVDTENIALGALVPEAYQRGERKKVEAGCFIVPVR